MAKKQNSFISQGLAECKLKQGNPLFHLLAWQAYKWFLIPSVGVWWVASLGRGRKTRLMVLRSRLEWYSLFGGQWAVSVKIWVFLPFNKLFHFQESILQAASQVYKDKGYRDVHCYRTCNCEKSETTQIPNRRELLKKLANPHIQYSRVLFRY